MTKKTKDFSLLKKLTDRLEELPEEKLGEVLDFVDFLQTRLETKPERGTPEALLAHAGSWNFEPGELDRLLNNIQDLRDMELEKQ